MTKTFRDLGVDTALCDRLADGGITHPFPIQELTLPLALDGHDLIGQARTGTGKTLAFGLPLLQRLDPSSGRTQALVIVPTRELCLQVHADLQVGTALGLTTISVYGGVGYDEQIEALTSGVHVVVGTPGRLLDLLNRGVLDLSGVTQLVLDEADEMLDMGFLPDVERLVEACTGEDRHTMLFSATMPTAIVKLARRYMDHPTFTRADHEQKNTAPLVTQHFFQVHRMDKPRLLARILQSRDRGGVYVFVRTKHMADRLVNDLEELQVPSIAIHGDLRQSTRERNLDRFRSGKATVLVCTEVAARGLDVGGVTHVVNYDCPDDEKMYLHRIGRTARAGEAGVAITFAEFNEIDRLNVIRKAVGATDSEVEQVFSTSKHLQEMFDLPDDRPWDHLSKDGGTRDGGSKPGSGKDRGGTAGGRADRGGKPAGGEDRGGDREDRGRDRAERGGGADGRGSSGSRSAEARGTGSGDTGDRRGRGGRDEARGRGGKESGGRPGRTDGRSKNARSSEGRGGEHDATRRDRAARSTARDDAPHGDGVTEEDAVTDRSARSTTSTRTRTRTRSRGAAGTDAANGRGSSDDDTTSATDTPASDGGDRDTSTTSSSTSSRPRARARGGRERGTGTTDDRTGSRDDRDTQDEASTPDDGSSTDASASPRSRDDRAGGRTRAGGGRSRGGRARGRRGGRDSSSRTGGAARDDAGSGETDPGDTGSTDAAATGTGTDARDGDARGGSEQRGGGGRGRGSRGGRGNRGGKGRGRGNERGGNAGGNRGGSRGGDRQQGTDPTIRVADRGEDARGHGQPQPARRVKVEHLP